MQTQNKVFLIGPGFIGGEILDLLIEEGYDLTALVRSDSAARSLQAIGVKTVSGSLDDQSVITDKTYLSDIVFHTATADHLPSVQAVLEGVIKRGEEGKSTIFIHTSGASLLGDDSDGEYKSDMIYRDDQPWDIDALPLGAAHREIDLTIVTTSKQLGAKARLAIMIPPLIYGVSSREKRLSIQLPTMVRYSMKHGYAGQIGKGLSLWAQVHVKDLAKGYITLLHHLENGSAEDIMQNPYWFCENGQERSWGECASEIGRALHQAGRLDNPEPKTIPRDLYSDLFGVYSGLVAGSNARNQAVRLRKLGWEAKEKDTIQSLHDDEIPILLKETGSFNGYTAPTASGDLHRR